MSELDQKNLKALRIAETALGMIVIGLSLTIIFNSGSGIAIIVLLLSITLFAAGAERIAAGALPNINKSSQTSNVIFGIIAIGLGFSVLAFPLSITLILVTLLAAGLLVLGIARIIQGITNKNVSKWSREYLIGVGILSLVVSFVVFAHPVSGIVLSIFLLSVNLLIIGIESIVHGVCKKKDMIILVLCISKIRYTLSR